MKESFFTVIGILTLIGICLILGIITRGTEKDDKDRDDVGMTLTRGFGTLLAVFITLNIVGVVIYVIYLIFDAIF